MKVKSTYLRLLLAILKRIRAAVNPVSDAKIVLTSEILQTFYREKQSSKSIFFFFKETVFPMKDWWEIVFIFFKTGK